MLKKLQRWLSKKNVKTPPKPSRHNASSAFWRIVERPLWWPRRMLPPDACLVFVVMLTGLVLLLSACQTPPPKPCEKPAPVTMPALSEPMPSATYSLSAASDTRRWLKRVTDTSATSKP